MEEKINIAELLKDCPQGMELYSPIFGKVYLDKIRSHLAIVVTIDKEQGDFKEEFLYDGRYGMNGECMLFPSKDKTTWEDFIPFNDGDILTYIDHNKPVIYIYRSNGTCNTSYYVGYSYATNHFYPTPTGALSGNRVDLRLATEEEKQKLFDAIKARGYRWNFQAKRLEKLIIPKFKKGDKVRVKNGGSQPRTIEDVCDTFYTLVSIGKIDFTDQDKWELVPDKFDVNTLKPFDKVLVRDTNGQVWTADLFSHIIHKNQNLKITFVCVGHYPNQCIPYEGNKHLLGTSNDCVNFYKTWE